MRAGCKFFLFPVKVRKNSHQHILVCESVNVHWYYAESSDRLIWKDEWKRQSGAIFGQCNDQSSAKSYKTMDSHSATPAQCTQTGNKNQSEQLTESSAWREQKQREAFVTGVVFSRLTLTQQTPVPKTPQVQYKLTQSEAGLKDTTGVQYMNEWIFSTESTEWTKYTESVAFSSGLPLTGDWECCCQLSCYPPHLTFSLKAY